MRFIEFKLVIFLKNKYRTCQISYILKIINYSGRRTNKLQASMSAKLQIELKT
jgi:hypothetical protein